MAYDSKSHRRRSIRLDGYDYSQPGAYFITICTAGKVPLFGEVLKGAMHLNAWGRVVAEEWHPTPIGRPNVVSDAFVLMLNHIHGLIMIAQRACPSDGCRGVLRYASTVDPTGLQSPSQTVGAVIRGFKGAVTKHINREPGIPGAAVWQSNYYEHIIRVLWGLSANTSPRIRCGGISTGCTLANPSAGCDPFVF